MKLLLTVTAAMLMLCPCRADDAPKKSERAEAVKFLKDHLVGKTFESPTATAKIDDGKLEAEYSSRASFANLRETKTGFSFEVVEEVKQINYPLSPDGKRSGPGKDRGRKHTIQYQVSESLSTGEILGVSIISERTIGADVVPAVFSAIKLAREGDGLLMTSSDVWYHDEFGGSEKGWKPGTVEVTQTFASEKGRTEVRVKVSLYEFNPAKREKKLSADVPERVMSEAK